MAQHSKARTKAEAQFKQVQKPQPATQPTTEGGQDKSTSGVDTSEAEGGKVADASPSGYSRGEGQKPVSKAYKDNWNAIFAKKKRR